MGGRDVRAEGEAMPEVEVLVGQVVPAISAAVGAYGVGVLSRVQDAAADGTVGLGRRLLARLLGVAAEPGRLEGAVEDLAAAEEDDPDAVAALRLQVRRILLEHPELAAELAGMLPAGPQAHATGTRSVAVAGDNTAPITTGDNSPVRDSG
jgi:hypothetical protein